MVALVTAEVNAWHISLKLGLRESASGFASKEEESLRHKTGPML